MAALFVALLGGCAPKEGPPDAPPPSPAVWEETGGGGAAGTGEGGAGGGQAACPEGATRTCTVHLGTHEGVESCFEGVQTCLEGTWGVCGDPPDSTPVA